MESYIRISGGFLFLNVKAVPGASKSALAGVKDGRLKVRIAAAPEDGKANEELRSFLAKTLAIPKKDIVVTSGEKSRLKTLRLPISAREKLEAVITSSPQEDKPRRTRREDCCPSDRLE
jgi:uncharacterized protein (TIGR00251 family)